jgi:hypothetical protein
MATTATDKLKVDSLVEDIFADQKVVAVLVPFEVAKADDIDLMDLASVAPDIGFLLTVVPNAAGDKPDLPAPGSVQ